MATSTISPSDHNISIDTISRENYRSDKHCDRLLKHLYSREDFYDVILIAGEGGERISAHRLILVGCSDYFSTMFTASIQEKTADRALTEVTIGDVAGETLEGLIKFCYTGNLEIKEDAATNLLSAAVSLKLNEVVEACCGFLQRHLKPSNCLSIAFAAEQHNFEGLLQNARKFICDHFVEVYQQHEFLLLSSVQLSQILGSDDFNAPSEDVVYAVIKWIEHDPEKRRNHLAEFLAVIRLPLIKPETLLRKVLPYCYTPESKDLILKALEAQLPTQNCSTKQVTEEERKLILVLFHEEKTQKMGLMCYCPLMKKWTHWTTPIYLLYNYRSVSMYENLILVGETAHTALASKAVISLNLRTMELKTLSSLITARYGHCMAVINDSVYVIGGKDKNGHCLSSVERLDPKTRSWSYVTSMQVQRMNASAAVLNGYIYVSGGYNDKEVLSSVECFNPKQSFWTTKQSMISPRENHALQANNGFLYAIGGIGGEEALRNDKAPCFEYYNPSNNIWTEIECSAITYSPHMTRSASLESDIFICKGLPFFKYYHNENFQSSQFKRIPAPIENCFMMDMVTIPYLTPPKRFLRELLL